MSKLEIRPRFKRMSRLTKENILEAFTPVFEDKVDSIDGHTSYGWIYLYIPKDDQHLWSPRLSLELEEEDGITQINAVFGPNPNVWLLFVFFYSLLGFLAMVILIIGGSRWNLGLSAGILWFIPVLIIIFLAAFLSARAGQKLAKEQMWELYNFFHETLDGEVFRPEDFTLL